MDARDIHHLSENLWCRFESKDGSPIYDGNETWLRSNNWVVAEVFGITWRETTSRRQRQMCIRDRPEEKLLKAKAIIALNKFKEGDYECNDEEINTVLNYYKITRDDAETN